jgi:hypothetical protein
VAHLTVLNLVYIGPGKETFNVGAFRSGDEGLRAIFKILQEAFYPTFIQFGVDIVDDENRMVIRGGILQRNRR